MSKETPAILVAVIVFSLCATIVSADERCYAGNGRCNSGLLLSGDTEFCATTGCMDFDAGHCYYGPQDDDYYIKTMAEGLQVPSCAATYARFGCYVLFPQCELGTMDYMPVCYSACLFVLGTPCGTAKATELCVDLAANTLLAQADYPLPCTNTTDFGQDYCVSSSSAPPPHSSETNAATMRAFSSTLFGLSAAISMLYL
jgi:hypothetical protein